MERQRFLITGASQGIGEALVRLACERGFHDVLLAAGRVTRRRIAAVASRDGRLTGIRADFVAIADDNQRTVDSCSPVAPMGGIDILVNNAGVGYVNPLEVDRNGPDAGADSTDQRLRDWWISPTASRRC